MKRTGWVQIALVLALIAGLLGCTPKPTQAPPGSKLILATTTSTENSGLLAYLLPIYTEETGVEIDVIAVGTGQALKLGEDGNADVLMVHARAREDAFMEAGHGVRREDLMYNDFVIAGPAGDPAGVAGTSDAGAALAKIAESGSTFVSRGDDSGTHTKEKAIWAAAGVEPAGDWYVSAGQGMGAVLTMAGEQQAYTLSDRATYLARKLEGIDLEIAVEGDPILFNPYGVMVVNPDKGDHIRDELANAFVDWLIAVETQEKIGEFGVEKFGAPLFTPDSAPWREAHPVGEAPAVGALKITGQVEAETGWSEDQVRAMDTIQAEFTDKQGETRTYSGVPLIALLDLAGVQGGATLTFVGDDGYTAEVDLAEARACADCIVSFRDQGGFSMVLPGFPNRVQVRGVIEIQVK